MRFEPAIIRNLAADLGGLLRLRDKITTEEGAVAILRFIPTSLILSGAAIVFISSLSVVLLNPNSREPIVLAVAISLLLVGMVLALVIEARGGSLPIPTAISATGYKILAVMGIMAHVGAAALVLICFVAIWPSEFASQKDFSYAFFVNGYYDKRWTYLAYVAAIGIFIFLPALLNCVLGGANINVKDTSDGPANVFTNGANLVDQKLAARERRNKYLVVAAQFFIAAIIAMYYWGPPWHLGLLDRTFDGHESVPVAASLAITQGRIPYTEAISQYGPGAQLLLHEYFVKAGFNVVALRESYAFVGVIAGFFYCLLCLMSQRLWVALLAIYFALAYSSFGYQAFTLAPDGALQFGQFAWNVPLRYLGAIFLGVTISRGLLIVANRRSYAPVGVIAIGLVWGLSIYLAQENFAAGIIVIALVGLLAVFTNTIAWRDCFLFLAWFVIGVLIVLVPIFGYYLHVGEFGRLIQLYFHLSGLVPQGFSNTLWDPAYNGARLTVAYYGTPFLLVVLGIGALYHNGSIGVVERLSARRLEYLGVLASAIGLFQGALFRADASHMTGFASAIPLLAAITIERWPDFFVLGTTKRRVIQVTTIGVLLFIFPFATSFPRVSSILAGGGIERFFTVSRSEKIDAGASIVIKRFGYWPHMNRPCAPFSEVPCVKLVGELTAIRAITGARPTIIHDLPNMHDSAAYFLADLTVGTRFTARNNSVVTQKDFVEWIAEIESPKTACLISTSVGTIEAKAFMQTHPKVNVFKRALDRAYVVLCSKGAKQNE